MIQQRHSRSLVSLWLVETTTASFPLRGKCKNVRDASVAQLTGNQEFNDLKKILGLQQGKEYKDVSELRYGRLMIMTDADNDGSHIKGLILNMIDYFLAQSPQVGIRRIDGHPDHQGY